MAELRRRFSTFVSVFIIFFFFFVFFSAIVLPTLASVGDLVELEEEFTEELLLKPLPDRKVLSHFHFEILAPPSPVNGRHHHLFPKAIAQLVHKFQIRELELSFTQGRWNYERWGGSDPLSMANAKPPGVELWATFHRPESEIDYTWKNLTHALSGLFCSSINFLKSSTAFSAPHWGFQPNSSVLRYGALPREAVCTENLTPWLKLLPCRDKAGVALLLNRPSIYRGHYHSQKLRLISSKLTGIKLEQTLTIVLHPSVERYGLDSFSDGSTQPSWSLNSLFKQQLMGKCAIAKDSRVLFELEHDLASQIDETESDYTWRNAAFELSTMPDRVARAMKSLPNQDSSVLYGFDVSKSSDSMPMDVGIKWKLPLIWSSSHAPVYASRFLMGSGNERGSIAITFQSSHLDEWLSTGSDGCAVHAVVFQVVPWYVKVYYHTLNIFMDGKRQTISDVVKRMKISPSEDKLSPGTMELMLEFPCDMQSATLTLDFDKGFLHVDEYPPDANQGFDIPSALITYPDCYSSRSYETVDTSHFKSSLLPKFKEGNLVQSYTEVLLVPLTTPDFSMPYNVITFTCTILALYFGSMLNVLRRRVGEEERLSKSKASERRGLIPLLLLKLSSKLRGKKPETMQHSSPLPSSSSFFGPKLFIKVVLVAVLAIFWNYYLKDS